MEKTQIRVQELETTTLPPKTESTTTTLEQPPRKDVVAVLRESLRQILKSKGE